MNEHGFAKGMTVGLMAGAAMGAMGMMASPMKKSQVKKTADKAIKAVGEMMEDLSSELKMR